jgi:hypothetical protein
MIAAYLFDRFPVTVFAPLAVAIAGAAEAPGFGPVNLGVSACCAVVLLLEFRLLDDLADRTTDTGLHPERVLVTAATLRPFHALLAALVFVNLAIAIMRDGAGLSLAVFVSLHAGLGAWYARRSGRTVAGDQLLLAKYPAFVFIVAGSRVAEDPWPIALGACLIYIAASAYEAWHDPASPVATFIGGRS